MSNGKWVPGLFVNKKALLFQPLSAKVKQIAKKMQSASDTELPAMQLQLSAFQLKLSAGKPVCKPGKPKSGGGGGSSPSPTPTPPPTSGSGCFDSSGSATSAGKAKFGIPSSYSANITAGKSAVQAMCSGCHSDELGKKFSQYRTAIALDPMFYDEAQVPNSTLANITAYLNRFSSGCN
jgi:mono/diheme cytochrome c family protein